MKVTTGIYCLEFPDSSRYVGRSSNIEKRYRDHKSAMERGTHDNAFIQKKYYEAGLPILKILEECSIEKTSDREAYWISEFGLDNLLNIKESDNLSYGPRHNVSKYSKETILDIFFNIVLNQSTLKGIAKKLNVPIHLVNSISRGETHGWIKSHFPDEYVKMLSYVGNRGTGTSIKDIGKIYPKIRNVDTNEIFEVLNINEFCRIHDLNNCCLHRLLNGKAKKHKNFVIFP